MDLRDQLIECDNQKKGKRRWKSSLASIGIHGAIFAFIIFMGASATHKVDAAKPISAFLSAGAPPPPPPPPPPAASSAPKSTPTPVVKPVQIPQTSFVQPRIIPTELPKVEIPTTSTVVDTTPSEPTLPSGGEVGGVAGGVVGGVAGGVQGGVVGGTVGGVTGGELGGVPGGVVGGTVGGTGAGEAKPEPPPPPENDGPLRVGGDVKAPEVTKRVEPKYTDTARKAHITGVVIVEATIDKNGNVDRVKVIKGLQMGLSDQAVEAVKQWKFRPGTLNGEPVDVLFNLTVNFTLQ